MFDTSIPSQCRLLTSSDSRATPLVPLCFFKRVLCAIFHDYDVLRRADVGYDSYVLMLLIAHCIVWFIDLITCNSDAFYIQL